jgi:hypothetical protein
VIIRLYEPNATSPSQFQIANIAANMRLTQPSSFSRPARRWIFRRYFLNKHVTGQQVGKNGIVSHRLYKISTIPFRYKVKIKSEANPYLTVYDKYFFKRFQDKEELAKECRQITTFIDKETTNSQSGSPSMWEP